MLEHFPNFKLASKIQIFQPSNSVSSRINDGSFSVALDIVGEWLHYLKMQEWLLLFPLLGTGFRQALIMWILWCAKFCESKLQLFQKWWAVSTFHWAVSMELGRISFETSPLLPNLVAVDLRSSKAKSKWSKNLMCNKILTHCATTQSFTSRENSSVTKTDVLLRVNSFIQLKGNKEKKNPNSNSILQKPHVNSSPPQKKSKNWNK